MNRIHLIKTESLFKVTTNCGMVGWRSGVKNEFETAVGRRFEAVDFSGKATCKLCSAARHNSARK